MGLNVLAIRKRLGRDRWHPPQRHGTTGWSMVSTDLAWQLVLDESTHDGDTYIHAALAPFDKGRLPTGGLISDIHTAVYGPTGHVTVQLVGAEQ